MSDEIYIEKEINRSVSSSGDSKVYINVDVEKDETTIIVEETMRRRFSIKNYNKIMQILDDLETYPLGSANRIDRFITESNGYIKRN